MIFQKTNEQKKQGVSLTRLQKGEKEGKKDMKVQRNVKTEKGTRYEPAY